MAGEGSLFEEVLYREKQASWIVKPFVSGYVEWKKT